MSEGKFKMTGGEIMDIDELYGKLKQDQEMTKEELYSRLKQDQEMTK